jgi:serine/threonine protein kinase
MEETKDPYIGLTLEGALLERKLGQGGMGAVYLARHLVLEKYIAIKILTPDLLRHPQSLERFLREAKTAAQLEHPNIIQVYHVGVQHSIHFLSMQYVPGQSLQKHLHQRGKIPLAPALTVIQKILEGLAFAHHCGVIHRDIKPDNIMITPQGQVKIVDFGLARSCQAGNTLSQTGQIMGTPYFMSPEQCNGETVDLRSDIYSLGITFYYLLSAQYPYDGQSAISI